MKIPVGSKVKFESERLRYTVQASDDRFAICTKPFNLMKSYSNPKRCTVLYSIIDFEENVRGPENLVFGMGAETRKSCNEMLARLTAPCEHVSTDYLTVLCDCRTEVSERHGLDLDIERIDPPKDRK